MEAFRATLIKCILALTRVLFFWLPGGDAAQGAALTAFHPVFMISWVLIFFLYPTNYPLRILICMFAILTMVSQWFFKGCIITRAEQFLTGSKETVVDPFLRFVNITPTKENRLAITIGISMTVTSIMIFLVCMDSFL